MEIKNNLKGGEFRGGVVNQKGQERKIFGLLIAVIGFLFTQVNPPNPLLGAGLILLGVILLFSGD